MEIFCRNADAVIFLTATPLQNSNNDLYTLLNLLRPDVVLDKDTFNTMSEPNIYVNNLLRIVRNQEEGWQDAGKAEISNILSTSWGRNVIQHNPEFEKIYNFLDQTEVTRDERIEMIGRIENLHSFHAMINRTRRRDIEDFCIRRTLTVNAPFTSVQQELYDALIEFESTALAQIHGSRSVRFMMCTIMRQAASCIHGLAPFMNDFVHKRLSQIQEDGELYEHDFELNSDEENSLFELADIIDRLSGNLPKADPKFDRMLEVIQEKQTQENNRVIIFSSFRHTLAYLRNRLKAQGIRVGQVDGSVPDEERFRLRKRFLKDRSDSEAIDVLLFSEVGCEGLDYQFCDTMINYDLPWNPMRIEQRIGRIDRRGQKSDTVKIYNMITDGTIDAVIYDRCLSKIGVFEASIGDCSEILGDISDQIFKIMFDPELTDAERQMKIEKMADNEVMKVQELHHLEQEEKALYGFDLSRYMIDKDVQDAENTWINPQSLNELLNVFMDDYLGQGEYLRGKQESKTLRLSIEKRQALYDDLMKMPLSPSNHATKRWKAYLKSDKPVLQVTFESQFAKDNREVTFLTQMHPFVAQAAAYEKIISLNEIIEESPSLQTLLLENLSLDRLPASILSLKLDFKINPKDENRYAFFNNKGIYIHNLSLSKQPVSLFYQKRELIERYYSEELISVNSAKIIFLGDGEVGKTYTLKRLLNGGKKATDENMYPTQTTHGVLIKSYDVINGDQNYGIKFWDFGGQQIMHSMHRCFLTERSCYVVMISTRTDRDLLGQARYWLRTVNSFAPNAPVIVLVNQWTKNLIKVDEYRLKEEFKNINQFLYFSVVDSEDKEFLFLKDAIIEQVRKLDCYGMEFPKSWYELMTDLENETHDLIPKSTYYRKCFEKGLRYEDNGEEGIYEWLLDWFNDLGVCFSYHKKSNSQILDNYELLNPQWLTRAAYILISSGEKDADNGILTRKQIENILSETEPLDFDDLGSVSYKPFQIEYILEILRKFQISYRLPDGRELIPVLCEDNSSGSVRPEWFVQNEMQQTSYEFHYEYLPDTIIHRLMIFCYQSHYHVRYRWRKGMTVDFSSDASSRLTAVIDSGNDRQSITIDIYSDGRIPCWQFLSKLREEILQINAELNLKAKDYINMETEGIKDRFSVESVLKIRARGWEILPADNYDGDYKISDILGSAYGPVNAEIIEKISVSQKGTIDSDSINQILSMLNLLYETIETLNDKSIYIENLQYELKEQITKEFENVFQNQDVIIAILNTLKKEPSLIKKTGKGLLSGLAVTADLVTLTVTANPDLPRSVCEKAAVVLEKLLQMMRFL